LGGGIFGPQQKVAEKPSANFGSYAISDFDGDGDLNLVVSLSIFTNVNGIERD